MSSRLNSEAVGLSKPPKGVVAGESIPRENEADEVHEQKRKQAYHTLRAKYGSDIPDERLREKADELARRATSDE